MPVIYTGPLGPITSRAYRLITEFPLHGAPCRYSNSCRVLLSSSLKFLPLSFHRFLLVPRFARIFFLGIAKRSTNRALDDLADLLPAYAECTLCRVLQKAPKCAYRHRGVCNLHGRGRGDRSDWEGPNRRSMIPAMVRPV